MAHKNRTNISPFKTRQESKDGPAKTDLRGRHKKPLKIYPVGEASDRLQDLFYNHEMRQITHEQRQKLAEFYVLLMESQQTENFTRLLTIKDVGIRHFIDCLIVAQITELKFPLMDVGTGPGFPGIPLKILFPQKKIILAEGVQRRVEFLKKVREDLKLEHLDIIGRNINPWFMYPVQGVITRAVEDVRNTLKNVLSSLQTGGRVYFMKGPGVDPEMKVAEAEVGEFYKLVQDTTYTLPQTSYERRLVVYEKIKMAPLPDIDDEPWPEDD